MGKSYLFIIFAFFLIISGVVYFDDTEINLYLTLLIGLLLIGFSVQKSNRRNQENLPEEN